MSWKTLAFEDCLERIKTPSKLQKSKYLGKGKFPVVAQEDSIINGYTNDENLVFKINSPIIIFGDHTRKLKYIDFNFVLGADGAKIIKPKSDINVKFFFYYLTLMMPKSVGYARHYKLLKKIRFNIPSLAEQQSIAAKLDATFAEINKLIEASEINIKNINKYIGRVTDYLIHNDIKNYKNFTLNDITNNITCGVAKRPEYVDKGIIFLSARNVKHGKMKWVNYKFISEEAHKILTKNSKPEVGDILYSRVGAGFGDAAIIDRDVELSIFVSLTLIKVKPIVLNEYIFYYLNSPIIKELARKNITGTGVGNLNVGAVKRFKIKLPDLKNQKLIIDKLKSLNILGENIINNYIKKKNNYIALKQSIYDSLLFNKKTKVA